MRRALGWLGWVALLALAACDSRIDPETGRAYRCSRDGGATCPDDWVCGLEGYCHSPAAERAFLCEDNLDCAPTWRCGVALTESDPRTCHPRNVPAPYACRSDLDCEAPRDGGPAWRCGPARTCLDPAQDELRATANYGALDGGMASPRLFQQLPQHLATSYSEFSAENRTAESVAWVENGVLGFLIHFEGGRDAGAGEPPVYADVARAQLSAAVRGLAVRDNHAYVLDSSGLTDFVWRSDGGLVRAPFSPSVTGMKLRQEPAISDIPIAFDSNQMTLVRDGGTTLQLAAPTGTTYLDVGAVPNTLGATQLVALTTRGIYVRSWDRSTGAVSPAWTPQDFGLVTNGACWPVNSARLVNGYVATSIGDAVTVTESSTATHPLVPVVVQPYQGDAGCVGCIAGLENGNGADGGSCSPIAGLPHAVTDGPCAVCPAGSTAVEVRLWPLSDPSVSSSRAYMAACQRADGTQHLAFAIMEGNFCLTLPGMPGFGVPEEPSNRAARALRASAGAHGQLWRWSDGQVRAVTPPMVPLVLTGEGDRLAAFVGAGTNTIYGFTPSAGLALQAAPLDQNPNAPLNQLFAQAPVQGRPGWALSHTGVVDLGVLDQFGLPVFVANIGSGLASTQTLTGSFVSTRDGDLLIVTAGDTLGAAELSAPFPSVESKLAPSPGSRIISSVMLPPPPVPSDGGTAPLAVGYVLTTNGPVQVAALSSQRWRAQPVEVIHDEADPLAVWADGFRGRVGHADGVVFSLPSRVPISPKLPNSEQVRSYAELCGEGVALSTAGNLYRLVRGDGGIGDWRQEDLAGLVGSGVELAPVKLYSNGHELYVMGLYGAVAKLEIIGGCR